MTARVAMLLIAIVAFGGLAAGCGGDDGGDDGSQSAGSGTEAGPEGGGADESADTEAAEDGGEASEAKAEYAEKANAICVENSEQRFARLTKYAEENPNEGQKESVKKISKDIIAPSTQELADEIQALGVPEGGEKEVEAINRTFREVAEATEKADGDLRTRAVGDSIRDARAAARAYGLDACEFQ